MKKTDVDVVPEERPSIVFLVDTINVDIPKQSIEDRVTFGSVEAKWLDILLGISKDLFDGK